MREKYKGSALSIDCKSATESDIASLIELEKLVLHDGTYSPNLEEKAWREELENNQVYLIKSADELVGYISYEVKSPERVYISGLVINPTFQGRGIGKNALQFVLEKYADAKRIDLVTHPENHAARALYESLGFQIEKRVEDYWGDGTPRLVYALKR